MIAIKKCFHKIRAAFLISNPIFCPPETLFPYRSVKTLNVGLFVFLVWPGNAVAVTILMHMGFECLLEFRTTIRLQELDVTAKPSRHALFEKLIPMFCRESRCHEDVCFSREYINPRKGKELAKVNRIHLDDLTRHDGLRDSSSLLVFLPL